MKRIASILLLFISSLAFAQVEMDDELLSLVSCVKTLRDGGQTGYDMVNARLAGDLKWTPMNETGPFLADECHPSEKVPGFRLNRILSQVAGSRKYVTSHGDMLNGEDERYDYSLYERSVHAGATVQYSLKGREGAQWFVIVPYSSKAGLRASLSVDGSTPEAFKSLDDGTLVLFSDTALNKNQILTLSVSANEAVSFVVLNHNTRVK